MRYRITRTSDWDGKKQPCKNAYQKSGQDDWDNPLWFVDVATIDDLQALMMETGCPIILFDGDYGDEIEIYDDYRE